MGRQIPAATRKGITSNNAQVLWGRLLRLPQDPTIIAHTSSLELGQVAPLRPGRTITGSEPARDSALKESSDCQLLPMMKATLWMELASACSWPGMALCTDPLRDGAWE